jgi:hypothetical protein
MRATKSPPDSRRTKLQTTWWMGVTGALKPGENKIQIKVTNQWMNRLIGDRSAPEGKKVLHAGGFLGFFGRIPPLSESGLIGPVRVVSVVNQ